MQIFIYLFTAAVIIALMAQYHLPVLIFLAILSAIAGLGFFNEGSFGEHHVFQRVDANSVGVICLAIVCAVLVYRTRNVKPQ